jgi:LDH2 family malate/lactate/ureidoglycolate dehydrogenase
MANVDAIVDGIKALPTAEGFAEVLVPGEPEDRVYAERIKHGIPLPAGTALKLRNASLRFGVPLPAGL